MINLITYKDRINFINAGKIELDILLRFLKDENEFVRLTVIKKLMNSSNKNLYTIELLEKIHFLIVDTDNHVRLAFAELLKKFGDIHSKDKERLFDVNDIGIYIYAVEDEDFYVKKAVIESLRYFLIPQAINFLIELLNETNKELRTVVSSVLRECTEIKLREKIAIKPSDAHIQFILGCLKEKNVILFENVLFILINLYTENEKMFFYLFDLNFPDDALKYTVLAQLIENNVDVYINYINANVNYVLNSGKSMLDEEYFKQIFIFKCVLCKYSREKVKELKISPEVQENLKFIDFKLKQILLVNKETKEDSSSFLESEEIFRKIPERVPIEFVFELGKNTVDDTLKDIVCVNFATEISLNDFLDNCLNVISSDYQNSVKKQKLDDSDHSIIISDKESNCDILEEDSSFTDDSFDIYESIKLYKERCLEKNNECDQKTSETVENDCVIDNEIDFKHFILLLYADTKIMVKKNFYFAVSHFETKKYANRPFILSFKISFDENVRSKYFKNIKLVVFDNHNLEKVINYDLEENVTVEIYDEDIKQFGYFIGLKIGEKYMCLSDFETIDVI
ncbi:hypothetical protein EHP00_544 [Ecytonucleospora hepatopenaei]|uniref:Uncharacterized protein n=1 Tax=Ecytonucleospora hepatopenaei TaxID=646526 RepID=A0A1W0E8M1_9MICR|nr:hypothetical protein EHP00_544 [Ecytonucleospora hepatopenaei]